MRKLKTRIKGIVAPFPFRDNKPHRQLARRYSDISNLAIQDRFASGNSHRVSHPYDSYEQEADQMADRVISMGNNDTPVAATQGASVGVPGGIQRKSHDAGSSSENTHHPPALSGSGRALPASARAFFEPRFGSDFGHVRIHDDPAAHQTAKDLNARAFTQCNHIGFDTGQYDPYSRDGKHLLAHELAHVSQAGDANKVYRESWDVDDRNREIERELLVQLIFEDTWSDMWNGTGRTTARKNTFRSNFVSSIENTFNNSSIVINPPDSAADVLPPENIEQGYKPLVDIDLVPDGETSVSEDWEVDVMSNPAGLADPIGGYMQSSSNQSYGTLNEAANLPVPKQGGDPGVTQIPTVHEFGHFIGLDHPGEGLEGSWLTDSQLSPGADEYSHTGTDQEGRTVHGPSDLMGAGMGLRPFYFDAWAEALDEHIADLRRAEQQRQFQRDWNMFQRALGNEPSAVEWFVRGMAGI